MQEILEFFQLKTEYIKIILFVWSLFKCLILFAICFKGLHIILNKTVKKIISKIDSEERKSQVLTLKQIISYAINAVVFAIFVMNMLNLFGIDIKPLLATAGVLGVAVGFGSKKIVEDIISGVIILLEGQIRVGDYVEILGMEGTVEKITLPLITVRSASTGALHYIRCGSIDCISNFTMNYSYSTFEFDVAYKENIDHVFSVLKKSFDLLQKDNNVNNLILDGLEIFGLDSMKESSLCVKCRIKTQPKGQWIIKRTFNKIVKEQFDNEGIEIPFNQIVVTNNN